MTHIYIQLFICLCRFIFNMYSEHIYKNKKSSYKECVCTANIFVALAVRYAMKVQVEIV